MKFNVTRIESAKCPNPKFDWLVLVQIHSHWLILYAFSDRGTLTGRNDFGIENRNGYFKYSSLSSFGLHFEFWPSGLDKLEDDRMHMTYNRSG